MSVLLTDLNVSYGTWPFQRFRQRNLVELMDHLHGEGIERAFVSHLGGVFHPDPDPFNQELFDEAKELESVVPVPVVNPTFPGWQKCLDAYRETANLKAVKVHPNFHQYELDSEVMAPLAAYLIDNQIPLLVQMRLEDERMRYAALDVQGVRVDDVIAFHIAYPELHVICLNAYLPEARRIGQEAPGVGVDTAFAEWLFTMELLLEDVTPERIFFGSHSPFLYTRASVDKLGLSTVDEALKRQIGKQNAERMFEPMKFV